jgi:pimeloyl-ACP methyl ester carboxylesterase
MVIVTSWLALAGGPGAAADAEPPYAHSEISGGPPTTASLTLVKAPGHPPIRLYAEETGRGAPLVLLHGFGASGYTFRRIVPELARHYRVITLDLKGHGRSDKPFDRNYSPRDQAVLVYWFLRARRLDRVTLVGHSFGGQVALHLALLVRRYDPQRIRRLVLMSAPVYPQPFTPAIRLLRKPVLPYVALTLIPREVPIALALMTAAVGLDRAITQQDIDIYAQPYADAGARHALIQTARQILPENAEALISAYPAVKEPTLILWCRDDHAVPVKSARKLARALPAARLELLDHCDHVPPEQRPGAVIKAIRRFAH